MEIIARTSNVYDELLAICNELEAVADALPHLAPTMLRDELFEKLEDRLKLAHEFEEHEFYPEVVRIKACDRKLAGEGRELANSLSRLCNEHWEDESFALELKDAYRQLRNNCSRANVELFAYMLRGFFEGLRRHIAFEREYLMAILEGGDQTYSCPTDRFNRPA